MISLGRKGVSSGCDGGSIVAIDTIFLKNELTNRAVIVIMKNSVKIGRVIL